MVRRIDQLYFAYISTQLGQSRIECHMNTVFIGDLAYVDDLTISCPNLRGLYKVLETCNQYVNTNHIIYIYIQYIKYGDTVMKYETALLNGVYLSWTDNVRHLGNYMCSNNDDLLDCTRKKSMFIGYVNKLRSNYGTTYCTN